MTMTAFHPTRGGVGDALCVVAAGVGDEHRGCGLVLKSEAILL